ncbi:MAG: hypothetical protein COX19_05975 [Desulfobacterales bacterium CG23_combo_of_CG06-09_8_20_14_all_51_8]|nr:MAG: hypothetical protein COX19_05975 [Desulfobacterales bacterium CG23_combo_of_CG06-09_8_20_14_all_51_8]
MILKDVERLLRVGAHNPVDRAGRETRSIKHDLYPEYIEVRFRLMGIGKLRKPQENDYHKEFRHHWIPSKGSYLPCGHIYFFRSLRWQGVANDTDSLELKFLKKSYSECPITG